ncbi:unnamed protein product [Moneuplotes crassus]|uniref:Uncharacterized protein n=1 Tax=Euplotes crassus TaxID=5936 RepID=A0AAD1U9I2_EUPCR|nr:unnamed protein product [Moneuplotes crassus]
MKFPNCEASSCKSQSQHYIPRMEIYACTLHRDTEYSYFNHNSIPLESPESTKLLLKVIEQCRKDLLISPQMFGYLGPESEYSALNSTLVEGREHIINELQRAIENHDFPAFYYISKEAKQLKDLLMNDQIFMKHSAAKGWKDSYAVLEGSGKESAEFIKVELKEKYDKLLKATSAGLRQQRHRILEQTEQEKLICDGEVKEVKNKLTKKKQKIRQLKKDLEEKTNKINQLEDKLEENEKSIKKLKGRKNKYKDTISEREAQCELELKECKNSYKQKLEQCKERHEQEIKTCKKDHKAKIKDLKKHIQKDLETTEQNYIEETKRLQHNCDVLEEESKAKDARMSDLIQEYKVAVTKLRYARGEKEFIKCMFERQIKQYSIRELNFLSSQVNRQKFASSQYNVVPKVDLKLEDSQLSLALKNKRHWYLFKQLNKRLPNLIRLDIDSILSPQIGQVHNFLIKFFPKEVDKFYFHHNSELIPVDEFSNGLVMISEKVTKELNIYNFEISEDYLIRLLYLNRMKEELGFIDCKLSLTDILQIDNILNECKISQLYLAGCGNASLGDWANNLSEFENFVSWISKSAAFKKSLKKICMRDCGLSNDEIEDIFQKYGFTKVFISLDW